MNAANNYKWFTLIEILIVITIIWILSIGTFVPYNLYANIAKVRLSREIVSQTMSEARNSAAWLIDFWTQKNQNIALFFNVWSHEFDMVSFPYDYSWAIDIWAWKKIKSVALENWVNINSISDKDLQEKDNAILYFKAPEGNLEIYKDSSSTWSIKNITIGIGDAKTWVLSKTLEIK